MNKQADTDWSKAVKIIANNRCEFDGCYRDTGLNSHHFFSRRFQATRYNVNNGFCLCVKHHFFAHQRSSEFTRWAILRRGEVWYEQLRIESKRIKADTSVHQYYNKTLCERKII